MGKVDTYIAQRGFCIGGGVHVAPGQAVELEDSATTRGFLWNGHVREATAAELAAKARGAADATHPEAPPAPPGDATHPEAPPAPPGDTTHPEAGGGDITSREPESTHREPKPRDQRKG